MSTEQIKIIFPAIIRINLFDNADIKLGGIYPEIEIQLIEKLIGLHEFSIVKFLPYLHPMMINPAIAEAEDQINYFWNVLAYIRDTIISPTGEVLYEHDKNRHTVIPKPTLNTGATLTGVANKKWFDYNKSEFHKKYDQDLLKRFNYSRSIVEPIGKYISLYSLLTFIAKDNQNKIDKLIESVEPNVAKYIPQHRRSETIYTRLRNELAHVRSGTSIIKTHSEIVLHLPRFEWIIKEILKNYIILP